MRLTQPQFSRSVRGLTFGEMLIVLAVFAILAIMFVISSNMAITKTRYARALQEQQRTIAQALQRYTADHMGLPSEEAGLAALTESQNQYLAAIPRDIFLANRGRDGAYQYFTHVGPGSYQALVVSVGPDGVSDVERELSALRSGGGVVLAGTSRRMMFGTAREAGEFIIKHSYDPTNGSISGGDVITPAGY
jgi:type II secretory pathway pseudopilin PulG